MAGMDLRVPTINQLMQMAIAIVILFFLVKLLPEGVRQWFRV